METTCTKCRFCHKILDRKSKSSAVIDEEIKYQFVQLTGITLKLQSFWDVVCVMCLRSLQLACDFQELLIDNEAKYHGAHFAADEGVIVDETSPPPKKTTAPTKPKTNKRKKNPEVASLANETLPPPPPPPKKKKKAKLPEPQADESDVEIVTPHSASDKENEAEPQQLSKKSKLDENGNELNGEVSNDSSSASTDLANNLFRCFHCKLEYCHKKKREEHILIHHMKRRYPCVIDDCQTLMIRRSNLGNHIRSRHKNLTPKKLHIVLEKCKHVDAVYVDKTLRLN